MANYTPLQKAILLTVLYADLFDYPLTPAELRKLLISECSSDAALQDALVPLLKIHLAESHGYITFVGREQLTVLRRRRHSTSQVQWRWAFRYANWLARVPFVRMAAVSGSLAVDNVTSEKDDVDIFCVTESNRLWIARFGLAILRVISDSSPAYLCPNYLLTLGTLEVQERNLFMAHQVTQIVPLWGKDVYQKFINANLWIKDFLPNAEFKYQQRFLKLYPRPWYTRAAERCLRGRFGDVLNRGLLWFFRIFQPIRLRRSLGWSRKQFQDAYRLNRQTQVGGGYVWIVQQRFFERARQHFGADWSDNELVRLFPNHQESPQPQPDPIFVEWFAARYQETSDSESMECAS